MAVHISTKGKTGIQPQGGGGGATAKKSVDLTPEQKKKLEDAFTKAITDTLGGPKDAWLSGGFSKE